MDHETLPHPEHNFGLKFWQSLLEYLISGKNEYKFYDGNNEYLLLYSGEFTVCLISNLHCRIKLGYHSKWQWR